MKKLLICTILYLGLTQNSTFAEQPKNLHNHYKAAYQHAWCTANNGKENYENTDFTKVDCLTENNAVKFDFHDKWAESIGPALHYQLMTGKKAKVILILENPKKQLVYYTRAKKIAEHYNFDIDYITSEILNLDKNKKCHFATCKCNEKLK